MKPVIKMLPKNGEVYTIRSSQGAYFAFDDYIRAACAVDGLSNSYRIQIDINESQEAAARLLQAENIYRQLKYCYDVVNSDVQYLPPVKTLPYGVLGTPLPIAHELRSDGAVYILLCSDGRMFCLNNFAEVVQMLMNFVNIAHIRIKKCNNALDASRIILARDASIQVMAGRCPQLLPPVRQGINYAVKGETLEFANKLLY